jgi:hypothetical protein
MSTVDAATDAPATPVYIQPNFDRMPPELKTLKNWLLWAPVWNGSKWTKRPIQISGYGASTIKSKHWSSSTTRSRHMSVQSRAATWSYAIGGRLYNRFLSAVSGLYSMVRRTRMGLSSPA